MFKTVKSTMMTTLAAIALSAGFGATANATVTAPTKSLNPVTAPSLNIAQLDALDIGNLSEGAEAITVANFSHRRGFRSRGFSSRRGFRSRGFNRGFRSRGFNRGFRSRGFNRGFGFGGGFGHGFGGGFGGGFHNGFGGGFHKKGVIIKGF